MAFLLDSGHFEFTHLTISSACCTKTYCNFEISEYFKEGSSEVMALAIAKSSFFNSSSISCSLSFHFSVVLPSVNSTCTRLCTKVPTLVCCFSNETYSSKDSPAAVALPAN
jgi:hypothetical protein